MNRIIEASELIITPKGSVYHLDLLPGQLAETIITVGDPQRVPEVTKHFDAIESKTQQREFHTHTGRIGHKRISVISTGIGTDNIDIVMNEIDALVNIDFSTRSVKENKTPLNIIRLGTSGSLQKNIPLDSVVITDFAIGLDNLLLFYKPENNPEEKEILQKFEQHTSLQQHHIHPYITSSSRSLSNHFQKDYHHGITVTSPGFYVPQGRSLRAHLQNNFLINALSSFHHILPVTNMEMETAALYGLGKILQHHCLSVSAIVTHRLDKTFSNTPGKTIEKMIVRALETIEII